MSDERTDPRHHPEKQTGEGAPPAPGADRFDAALRRWAERPPGTPAAEAARRIESRLPPRHRRRGGAVRRIPWAALTAAAVLAAAVGLGALFFGGLPETAPPASGPAVAAPEAPPSPEAPAAPGGDVLVIDLDERTTLYMNLAPAG